MTPLLVFLLCAAGDVDAEMHRAATRALEADDLAAAALALDAVLGADPDDVEALEAAALVAEELGKPQQAVTYLERLLALDPYDDEARLRLAQAAVAAGDLPKGREQVAAVLGRHPEWSPARRFAAQLDTRMLPTLPGNLRPQGRVGLSFGYDTNVALGATALPQVAHLAAPFAAVDATLGASVDTDKRPLAVYARFTSLQPVRERTTLSGYSPTSVGMIAVGRHRMGKLLGTFDLRYDEVFTDSFASHRARIVSPSLLGSIAFGEQQLRLLGGADYRDINGARLGPDNITWKASLRDTLVHGKLVTFLDLGARRNQALRRVSSLPRAGVDFSELGADLYGELGMAPATLFARVGAAARHFDRGLRESTYSGELGARARVGRYELHAEYGYAQNLSGRQRSYTRHTIFAGVRAWLQ